MSDLSWMDRAACRGMDIALFFPDFSNQSEPAKRVCASCRVQDDCLGWALTQSSDLDGIWGGKSKYQRTRMRGSGSKSKRRVKPGGMAAINARKTHCKRNHPFDQANTGWNGKRRYCRECNRQRVRARRAAA